MMTIGQLARQFGLSRSTLLYYDSIGLLSPSERSRANYRLYSDEDVRRMELIDLYRRTGIPLSDITRILTSDRGTLAEALETRLRRLNEEIVQLRRQQQMIVNLMQSDLALSETRSLDKNRWVAILEASGMDEADMRRWHVEFERLSPLAHQDFLESLGIEPDEITRIREGSKKSSD